MRLLENPPPPSIWGVPHTRIKICGVTCVEDALAAARAGADAIGMVFYKPAPRCVSLDTARDILAVLPPFITPVGLFVDAGVAEIRHTVETLGLRHVQLHGHETPESVAALRDRIVLKAVRVAPDLSEELAQWRLAIAAHGLTHLRGLILETAGKGVGGMGIENDWSAIARLQRAGAFDGLPPLIAAGGLKPDNVARVIRELRPCAVDVSSGVESSPGRKSPEKMAAFIREAAAADAEST
jgi:phosphoribosylanthranilate isomerase